MTHYTLRLALLACLLLLGLDSTGRAQEKGSKLQGALSGSHSGVLIFPERGIDYAMGNLVIDGNRFTLDVVTSENRQVKMTGSIVSKPAGNYLAVALQIDDGPSPTILSLRLETTKGWRLINVKGERRKFLFGEFYGGRVVPEGELKTRRQKPRRRR